MKGKVDEGCRQMSKFSVLITGSYHGALLALYNHVPVVAVYNSTYYKQKFVGSGWEAPGSIE